MDIKTKIVSTVMQMEDKKTLVKVYAVVQKFAAKDKTLLPRVRQKKKKWKLEDEGTDDS